MADEEVKPVEEVVETPETPTQEELPLAAATEEASEEVKAADPEGDKPTEPVKEEPKEDWKDKELKSKHRKLKEADRLLAEKDAEIAARDALLAKFNQDQGKPATPQVDEVDRRAKELVAQQRYAEDCNKVATKGEEVYKDDWKQAVSTLEILGGFDMPTMSGVLATDDPAKVLFELGKNPEKYHSIMALPLERRIIEMGKIAMAQSSSKPVSSAPAPVNPVGGRAAPAKETLTDNMDDDKWYQIRLAQKRAKYQANQVRR